MAGSRRHDLIIVPGHASFKQTVPLPLPPDYIDDRYWALQPFQRGEPPYYREHIDRALELAGDDSLLVFSGGRTRAESGREWSEARTYDQIARLSPRYSLASVALEEYARDSFQNVDFSIRLFRERQGYDPRMVTVVGWIFKSERFYLHAQALGRGAGTFCYEGVNNPAPADLAGAVAGEQKTIAEFRQSPYGDTGPLRQKRVARDPFGDGNPWYGAF